VGLRKGNYKLWGDVGRDCSPDWPALVAALESADLKLFDLSKDAAEQNDLRTQFPEVYATLKEELIDHFVNVNAEYPTAETHPELFKSVAVVEKQPTSKKATKPPARKPRKGKSSGFAAIDKNGDGQATLEEIEGWFKSRAEAKPDQYTYKPNQPKGALAKRDANKDGVVTEVEWNNAAATK